MGLKQDIIDFSREIKLDKIGFTTAMPFINEKEILAKRIEKKLISPFESRKLEERCEPQKILAGARTIICFAIGYLVDHKQPKEKDVKGHGRISFKGAFSRYTQVKDYHLVLAEKLKKIVDFISKNHKGRFKIMVDTGSLLEKAAAQRAGIGWIGENTCLYTPELGSWVFLGEILTDIEIDPDKDIKSGCLRCGLCVNACPTGALVSPFQINPGKCLSYITQMRGTIPLEFRKHLGNRVFGCDTCQAVCPNNQNKRVPNHGEFILDFPLERDLERLALMSKKDFSHMFNDTPAGWRGKNVLRRNAICAIGNSKEKGYAKLLKKLANDPSEIIKEQALWSLNNIC